MIFEFTIKNISKICKKYGINALIYIPTDEWILHIFVNSQKEKDKLKILDEIRPAGILFDIEIINNMVIKGFIIIDPFDTEFFGILQNQARMYKCEKEYIRKNIKIANEFKIARIKFFREIIKIFRIDKFTEYLNNSLKKRK